MLIYLMGNIEKEGKLLNKKLTYVLTVLFTVFVAYKAKSTLDFNPNYLDNFKMLVALEIFGATIFGILNINNEKIKNYCIYGLIIVALMSGLTVNPVIRTTDIFYTKPVAIKMQEIKEVEPEAIWAVHEDGWYINDYAVANGIRTINSTGVYPNLELFETILGDKAEENRITYNRYAHINFKVTDEESEVELLYADNVAIRLNYKDLEKLNIKYILSKEDFNEKSFKDEFEEVYNEDGMYIYKVK